MDGTPLDDILSDEPNEPVEAAQPETIGQPRDEQGRFASQETGETQEPESVTPTQTEDPAHIPIAALKDERTKRQQIEAEKQQLAERLAQYDAYFEQLNNQQAEQGPPDPAYDPVGYAEWVSAQSQNQVMPQVQQMVQEQVLRARVDFTETLARQKWADYDEKVELFKAEAQRNPYLVQQMASASDPASFAYQVANQIAEARQYSSGNAMPDREQLKAQLREELKAELGLSNRQAPTSLANERSVGSRSGPAWSGPTPIGDILGG